MAKMICPRCLIEGKKSKSYPINQNPIDLPACYTGEKTDAFYDETGNWHGHSIRDKEEYRCDFGHIWFHKPLSDCWCGWSSPEEIGEI